MPTAYGVHWFRRDLRVAGNPALQKNFKKHSGRVVGIFCFDHTFLKRPDFSVNRFQFFLETLVALKQELLDIGSDLLVLDEGPEQAFSWLVQKLKHHRLSIPTTITWNRDYEPFARARDARMLALFEDLGIEASTEADHLLIEPHEIFKDTPEHGYQVYTPFSRKWLDIFANPSVSQRIEAQENGLRYLKKRARQKEEKLFSGCTWKTIFQNTMTLPDALQTYLESNKKKTTVTLPDAGSMAAYKALETFKDKIGVYGETRDYPCHPGTSGFSIYLKNGSLTIAQIISYLGLTAYGKEGKSGRDKFFSELIWREFYYHILYRHPHVENSNFQSKYKNLRWGNNETWFEAWKTGTTGFPIVDAGMRQLQRTGLMHNRVRMIVASFLTKDLLIDWRWGENHFMKTLLDGDMAPNNGGWQWAASTGCDAQPYFRIFNPWSQSEKFDPNATYIKTFVPELREVPASQLHEPAQTEIKGYPRPIVEHSQQREKALELYK